MLHSYLQTSGEHVGNMWGTYGESCGTHVGTTSRPVVVGPCVAPRSWRLVNTEVELLPLPVRVPLAQLELPEAAVRVEEGEGAALTCPATRLNLMALVEIKMKIN